MSISALGIWIIVAHREYFAAFSAFPWFERATVAQIMKVQEPHAGHLFWPDLDVDLCVDSLADPDHFPLVARTMAKKPSAAASR